MSIYSLLKNNKKKRISFSQLDEVKFYNQNRIHLNKGINLSFLQNEETNLFKIFRSNIVIQGILNKKFIEDEVENLNKLYEQGQIKKEDFKKIIREKIVDLPYYQEGDTKIYIPFFSRALNAIYVDEPEKLLEFPYFELRKDFFGSLLDPFDTYGFNLYDSYFTRLVKVKEDAKSAAYFHYDTNTIYFVNCQGRLDNELVLFDKYIKHPNYNHMLERLRPVIDAYFSFDREQMIRSLEDNKFISSKFLYILMKKEAK